MDNDGNIARDKFCEFFEANLERDQGDGKRVIVVNGAPGSGKSHYVSQHARTGDIVLDLDKVNEAISPDDGMYQNAAPVLSVSLEMRKAFLKAIKERKGDWNTAYIISATPSISDIKKLGHDLGAEVITMNVPLSTCIDNIEADGRRADKEDHISRATSWYKKRESAETRSPRDLFSEWAKKTLG